MSEICGLPERRGAQWMVMLVALVILGGCAGPSASAPAEPPSVSGTRTGASAAEDLRATAAFIEDVHPAPYRFIEAQDFSALVEQEARALEQLEAPDEFRVGQAFHRVAAALGDFHIKVGMPLFGDESVSLSLLPVVPKRAGEGVYVDAASEAFPPGTELKRIDGRAVDEIYAALRPLVSHDGRNDVAELRELERDFAKYYHLTYGMAPSYEVAVQLPGVEEEEVRTLDGLPRQDFAQLRSARRSAPVWGPQPAGAPTPFRVESHPSVAYLRVPSFGVADESAFVAAIDAFFAGLEDETTLIIDLRGNEGGQRRLGFPILGRLIDAPYRQWKRMHMRVNRVPDEHRGRVVFPFVESDAVLSTRFDEPGSDGRYISEGDPLAELMVPVVPAFDADRFEDVLVFVDGLTNSASNSFAVTLAAYRDDVTMVGEEVGGDCSDYVGEFQVVYVTPNYGLHVLMSLIHIEHIDLARCEPGRGLRPDVEVVYEVGDLVEGRDPYLEVIRTD